MTIYADRASVLDRFETAPSVLYAPDPGPGRAYAGRRGPMARAMREQLAAEALDTREARIMARWPFDAGAIAPEELHRGPFDQDDTGPRIDAHQRAWILRDALARMLRYPVASVATEERWHEERLANLTATVRQERAGNGGRLDPFAEPLRRGAYLYPVA